MDRSIYGYDDTEVYNERMSMEVIAVYIKLGMVR
jgi:hypothetical protein